jgi:2,6-dihydroxypseudooxynicotine hydrolase
MRVDDEVPVRCAVDYLEGRGDIDAGKVGLLGVSVGGYYAPRAAAFEPRLRAVISLSGGYRLADYFDDIPNLTREAFTYRLKAPDQPIAKRLLERFDLTGVMQRIGCPLLVIVGEHDRLFPAEAGKQMVDTAGGEAELWMLEDGNHVCNNMPFRHRPQMADWMRRKLQI